MKTIPTMFLMVRSGNGAHHLTLHWPELIPKNTTELQGRLENEPQSGAREEDEMGLVISQESLSHA